jgi:hypothetical protein
VVVVEVRKEVSGGGRGEGGGELRWWGEGAYAEVVGWECAVLWLVEDGRKR